MTLCSVALVIIFFFFSFFLHLPLFYLLELWRHDPHDFLTLLARSPPFPFVVGILIRTRRTVPAFGLTLYFHRRVFFYFTLKSIRSPLQRRFLLHMVQRDSCILYVITSEDRARVQINELKLANHRRSGNQRTYIQSRNTGKEFP